MENILNEVKQERIRQDKKWGQQNHHPVVWNAILGEEVGEVTKEVVDYTCGNLSRKKNIVFLKNMREELIQTAAVAVAMVESLDRNQLA